MSLLHRWPCDEGSGNIVHDIVGGNDYNFFPFPGQSVQWARGDCGPAIRKFLSLAHTYYPTFNGALQTTTGLGSKVDNFTIGFVGRFVSACTVGVAWSLSSLKIRTEQYYLSILDTTQAPHVLVTEDELLFGTWGVYVLVGREGRYLDVYYNDMVTPLRTIDALTTNKFQLGGGDMRLMNGQEAGLPGGMEFADLMICDHSASQVERETYKAEFFDEIPGRLDFRFCKRGNEDFGGLFRRDQNDGSSISQITIHDYRSLCVHKHIGGGHTSVMGVCVELPRDLQQVCMCVEMLIPKKFSANHESGSEFNIMGLYDGYPDCPDRRVYVLQAEHDLETGVLTLERVLLRIAGMVYALPLSGREIKKGKWHTYKIKVKPDDGLLGVCFDGDVILQVSGLPLGDRYTIAYWGLDYGVCPDCECNYILTKNHYVGFSEMPSDISKQRLHRIMIDKLMEGLRYGVR